ncbi:hypothetical protein SERLADRAFT_477084, partial [Serpula lacrymans var. lacrymans S7.9]
MSPTMTAAKTAEFARLFDLFDRLATRRSRSAIGDSTNAMEEDISGIPDDFAPVMRNFTALLATRALRDQGRRRKLEDGEKRKPFVRPRRNTLAATPSTVADASITEVEEDELEDDDDMTIPAFPLGQRYPFTFKLMLHKLYGLEEWAEKVKGVVEASKAQFLSLAERTEKVGSQKEGDNTIRQNARRVTRARSHSVLTSKTKNSPLAVERMQSQKQKDSQGSFRVLKKRCVGRRKSVNGPMIGGGWVYDAAIASVELNRPRLGSEIPTAPMTNVSNIHETRSRHQSLAALEGISARDAARKRVNFVIPDSDLGGLGDKD